MSAVVMATACLIGKFIEGKTTPNVNLVHTPPPTGNLPTFPAENRNTGRNK